MILCGLLLVVALGLLVQWRRQTFTMPIWQDADQRPSVGRLLRVYLWLLCVGAISGLIAGVLVVGPGGRLAMRRLAASGNHRCGWRCIVRRLRQVRPVARHGEETRDTSDAVSDCFGWPGLVARFS